MVFALSGFKPSGMGASFKAPQFGWSKANPPQDYTFELTQADVNMHTLTPKPHFVAQIAKRLIRNHNTDVPGFVVIPKTKPLLKTKARAEEFQENLMRALMNYMLKHHPNALKRNNYSQKPGDEGYGGEILDVNYFTSQKYPNRGSTYPHIDYLRAVYLSLLYGPNRNIEGGHLKVIDALEMKRSLGYKHMRDVAYTFPCARVNIVRQTNDDMAGALEPEYLDKAKDYTYQLKNLDANQYPIVLMNNRFTEGIFHAGGFRRKKPGQADAPASSSLRSYNIQYFTPEAHKAMYG